MVALGYGQSSVSFEADHTRFQILENKKADRPPLTDVEIGAAIDAPIGSPPLGDIVSSGQSALIVVSDATRATGSPTIVNLLVRRLIEAGIMPGDIRIIFATGIHRKVSANEKRDLLTPFVAQRIRTIDHDPHDQSQLISLGNTAQGTPVELNRFLQEHDHVILTGSIGFHYFAGFTGGRKSICPGLASARTIEATHKLAIDFARGGRRAGVATGHLDGNAVHEECERIASLVRPAFLINTIVDSRGHISQVFAGHWRDAHRAGCEQYAASHSTFIAAKRPLVVAGCGGSPWDINLIQAHKSLEMASHACEDGGNIILLAECAEGFGRSDFLKWFDAADSRVLELRLREQYEVNGQTAWSLLSKAERFKIQIVSKLDEVDVKKMRMTPATSLVEALSRVDESLEGYILPHASSLLPICDQP